MSTKKKKNHHSKPKTLVPLQGGEARVTQVASKDGTYVRITAEYRSLCADGADVCAAITSGMIGGAKIADLRILAKQREDEIVRGEILTPDGLTVVEAWIPGDDELIILKSRPSSLEDLATMERYGEHPDDTEARKAEAAKILAERTAGPAILAGVGDAVD